MRRKQVLVFLTAASLATAVSAQTKLSGTQQCSKSDPSNAIEVGDRPDHLMALARTACTWTMPIEIAGVKAKDGTSVASNEINGDQSVGSGYHVGVMANGDRFFVRFYGKSSLKGGAMQSTEGAWSFTGGTGKLKGLKGRGKFTGKGAADGTAALQIEGEYQLP
jgi:hypothetical protein